MEKHNASKTQSSAVPICRPTVGLTLYVKKSKGTTKSLSAHDSLLTFLEGLYPNNPTKEVLRCDRILLISGGIGSTAVLPFVCNHSNVKLVWSVKESTRCLVDDLDGVLGKFASSDKDVRLGNRLDIGQLLAEEMETGWKGWCGRVRAGGAL